jgi:AcrR family transcriptional regulator
LPRERARRAAVERVTKIETVRDLRRSQIIAAARALVSQKGIEALTIAGLEARLGFTRGVITYHFTDKDEIERAVLESAVADIDQALRAALDASASHEDRLRTIVRANVRGFVDRPEAGRVLLSLWARLSSDARLRTLNAELYARYRRGTRKLLESGARAGDFVDVDPDAAATFVVGAVLGIVLQWYFDPDAIDREAATEIACDAVAARLLSHRRRHG